MVRREPDGRSVVSVLHRRRPQPEVHRITGAQRPHSDDLSQRMGRYLVSMLVRTVCVVLVLVIHSPIRWAFAVGAVLLPYVAVVMANAGQSRRDPAPPSVDLRAAPGPALPTAPGTGEDWRPVG
jgi:Flp pilus assembly protein TadB